MSISRFRGFQRRRCATSIALPAVTFAPCTRARACAARSKGGCLNQPSAQASVASHRACRVMWLNRSVCPPPVTISTVFGVMLPTRRPSSSIPNPMQSGRVPGTNRCRPNRSSASHPAACNAAPWFSTSLATSTPARVHRALEKPAGGQVACNRIAPLRHSTSTAGIGSMMGVGSSGAVRNPSPCKFTAGGGIPANPNTVHFVIRIAADTSIRVVGCGVRGRNG